MESKLFTRAFALLFASSLLFSMSYEMLRPIVSIYASGLGASGAEVGLVYSALVFSAVALRFPVGGWVDRHGRRGMLLVGTLVYTAAPLLYSVCGDPAQLVAVRLFHGVGMAAFTTASTALVADLVARHRLGEGMGLFASAQAAAMAFGPALVGFLVAAVGFTLTFYVMAAFAFASFLAVIRLRDAVGFGQRAQGRLLDALGDVNVLTASTCVFFTAFAWGAVVTFFPVYSFGTLGISTVGVGAFFTVYGLCCIATRPVLGRLSDRRGRMVVLVPALLLAAASIFFLALVQDIWQIVLMGFAFGLGQGTAHPLLNAINVETVAPSRRGVAISMFMTLMEVGMAIGALSMGFVAQVMGYPVVFMLAAVILASGTFVALGVRRLALRRDRSRLNDV